MKRKRIDQEKKVRKRQKLSKEDRLKHNREKAKKKRITKKRQTIGKLYNASVFGRYFPIELFKIVYDYLTTEYLYNPSRLATPKQFVTQRCQGRACTNNFAIYYHFDCITVAGRCVSDNTRCMTTYCFEHSPYIRPIEHHKMISLRYKNEKDKLFNDDNYFNNISWHKKTHVKCSYRAIGTNAPIVNTNIFHKKFSWSDILPLISHSDAQTLLEETCDQYGMVIN